MSNNNRNKKPNILWIQTDEQRYDSLGCYGNKFVHTPNIDILAQNGVLFKNHYTTSPQCVPARASIMTGAYPHTIGVMNNNQVFEPWIDTHLTFPEILEAEGYRTATFGKSHLSLSPNSVWQEDNRHILFENEVHYNDFKFDEDKHEVIYMPGSNLIVGGWYPDVEDGRTPTTYKTDQAINWLESQDNESPFLLRVSFNAPHTPLVPPKYCYDMYAAEDMPIPNYKEVKPASKYHDFFRKGKQVWKLSEDEMRRAWVSYYGLVTHVDQQVGRLINKLKELGRYDNTIIVYSSDHGSSLGEHGMWTKGFFYEQSAHIPFFISAPKLIPGGQVVNDLSDSVDEGPTILNLCGISIPDTMEGKPLLRNPQKATGKDVVFGEIILGCYRVFIRKNNYTMAISWYDGNGKLLPEESRDGMLFDLKDDLEQVNNLYNNPKYKEIQQELTYLLKNWLEKDTNN